MFKKKRLFARLSPQQTKHLEAGNSFIALLNVVLFISLAALLFLICLLTLLEPSQKLYLEQEKLVAMEKERDQAFLLKEQKEKELNWLLSDPEYFEIIVRDTLDMAKPGETILRLEDTPPPLLQGDDSPNAKKTPKTSVESPSLPSSAIPSTSRTATNKKSYAKEAKSASASSPSDKKNSSKRTRSAR